MVAVEVAQRVEECMVEADTRQSEEAADVEDEEQKMPSRARRSTVWE
jgi:hypothetical protein